MPYVSIQELGEAVREADKEAGMSEQQLLSVLPGEAEAGLGFVRENLCPDVGETVPHLTHGVSARG